MDAVQDVRAHRCHSLGLLSSMRKFASKLTGYKIRPVRSRSQKTNNSAKRRPHDEVDMAKSVVFLVLLVCMATSVFAADCKNLPNDTQLRSAMLASASSTGCTTGCVGGLFQGQRMWGAVVNRDGEICAF